MATKVWKGHLSFGLLSIPIYLNVGAREKRIEMRNYHVTCKQPVNAPKYCGTCKTLLEKTEMFRAYESGGNLVPVTDEELEEITPETGHSIEITEFVALDELDPLYLAESFFVLPDAAGAKAYSLLVQALTQSKRAALGQLTKSGRENIVALRPRGNGLTAHYLWFADEVNRNADFDDLQKVDVTAGELKLATQLVDSLASDFNPESFEDGYRQRLVQLIQSKTDKSVPAPIAVKAATKVATIDIMAALKDSLAKTAAKTTAKPPVVESKAKGKSKKSKAA